MEAQDREGTIRTTTKTKKKLSRDKHVYIHAKIESVNYLQSSERVCISIIKEEYKQNTAALQTNKIHFNSTQKKNNNKKQGEGKKQWAQHEKLHNVSTQIQYNQFHCWQRKRNIKKQKHNKKKGKSSGKTNKPESV
mmetsp:Transcript_69457/g.110308  ORF Transcript_69457/g.110308 Transcript_69457/m.110308 type:complete len:136 (+) Transcript_69457:63-470(+)